MDKQVTIWTLALCAGLAIWLHLDLKSMHINYDWHSYLVDPKTGHKLKPNQVLDLGKIINYTTAYINQTNAIERLYDLQFQSNLENPYTLDQSYSDKRELEISGWPVANQRECGNQLDWILEQLARHVDYQLLRGQLGYELTQMLDSFGRPESGLYAGTVTWLGSHKQCQRTSLDGGRIKMRYCQARMRPKWWPINETVHPKSRLKIGICLPETCDTNSFEFKYQRERIEALIRFDIPEFFRKNLEFDSMFCLPDERSPIRQMPECGHIYLLVVSLWLALVFTASIMYEIHQSRARQRVNCYEAATMGDEYVGSISVKSHLSNGAVRSYSLNRVDVNNCASTKMPLRQFRSKVLEALSIHHSLKDFKSNAFREQKEHLRSEKVEVRVDLGSIDFFKVLMAIVVVLAHSCYLTSVYTRSITNRIDMNVNNNGRMALSAGRCVDTFFMFFGVLTSYTLLRKFTENQLASPMIWISVNMGILLRITPVFMLIYWYSRSVSPYTGSGPWWDYGIYRYSMKGNCFKEPWWKSIPYFGCSGTPPVATCLLPAWFIVSYSQLALIMPILTFLLLKLPNHMTKILLLLFTTGISCAQLAFKMRKQTSFREEAFTLYGSFIADLMEKFESTGTMATLGRVGCVSIGCYVGYVLRMYEVGRIKKWPSWCTSKFTLTTATVLHFMILFLPLIGHKVLQHWNQHVVTMSQFISFYLTTMVVWPVLNAIIIVNGVTLYNRTAFVRFLSHSFWHTANKLGLCIFLVHWEVIFIGVTGYEHAPSMGFVTDVMKMWSFGVFFSVLFSFVIHILFEAPVSNLLKLLASFVQERMLNSPLEEIEENKKPSLQ